MIFRCISCLMRAQFADQTGISLNDEQMSERFHNFLFRKVWLINDRDRL